MRTIAGMSTALRTPILNPPTDLAAQAAQHQERLRTEGFTVFPAAITPEQIVAARAACDALVADPRGLVDAGPQHYGAPNLVARAAVFRDIALQPLVLATVEGLLGDDCILSSCNLGVRRPGGDRQGMHRDTGIWGPSLPLLDIPVGIQTAWCFDDFTLANGATHIQPGSHRRAEATADDAGIQVEAPAGSIIAFDVRCFHAGGANRTDRVRRAALTLYIRSWLKPQTDHKRSFPQALIADADPVLLRLLGFQRQSPVEHDDGRSEIIPAPGATYFYNQPPEAVRRPVAY